MPQVPQLFKKPRLSGLFDDDESVSDWFDFSVPDQTPVDPSNYVYATEDGGYNEPVFDSVETIFVDDYGNTVDANGEILISADDMQQVTAQNPGAEAEGIARVLKSSAPDWASQFRTTDDLIKAAAGLAVTVKAVVTGKPIPQTPAQTGTRPITPQVRSQGGAGFSLTNLLPKTATPALLVGGAVAAYLLLRRK